MGQWRFPSAGTLKTYLQNSLVEDMQDSAGIPNFRPRRVYSRLGKSYEYS